MFQAIGAIIGIGGDLAKDQIDQRNQHQAYMQAKRQEEATMALDNYSNKQLERKVIIGLLAGLALVIVALLLYKITKKNG